MACSAALAACSGTVPLAVEAPARAGDVSMIAALILPDRLELIAVELAGARAKAGIATAYDGSQPADLVVLLYQRSLADLELDEGPITLAAQDERSRSLPDADAIFTADALGDQVSPWMRVTALEPRLAELKIPKRSRCVRFDSTPLVLTSSGGAAFGVKIAGDQALVGTGAGGVFRVSRDGEVRPLAVVPPQRLYGAFQMNVIVPQDTVMLGGDRGQLFVGHVGISELVLTPVSTSTLGKKLKYVAGQGSIAGTIAFTLSEDGVFEHFDGMRWRQLWSFGSGASEGAIAYLSQDEAIGGWANTSFVERFKNGDLIDEDISGDPSLRALARTMLHIPALGTVLGSEGKIFLNDGGGWRELPGSPLSALIQSIAPYPGGFIAGSIGGAVAQYVDGEFCELERAAGAAVEYMVDFESDVLLLHGDTKTEHSQATLIRPMR